MIFLPQASPYESPLWHNSMLLEQSFLSQLFCYHYFPHFQSQVSSPFPPEDNWTASSFRKNIEIYSFNWWILLFSFLSADVPNDCEVLFFFPSTLFELVSYELSGLLHPQIPHNTQMILTSLQLLYSYTTDILTCITFHHLNRKPCNLNLKATICRRLRLNIFSLF